MWYFNLFVFIFCSSPAFAQMPLHYMCNKTHDEVDIDGILNEDVWNKAKWSELFVDIEGLPEKNPTFDTKVKLLWDDFYLYIGAEMIEPHIWANLIKRDEIIYKDNDFEIFIDPNGDNQLYYEIEINALNTVMDLIMPKPYHAGGKYLLSMNIPNLKTAVKIDGTINNPNDIDKKWTVEIAIPLNTLSETLYKKRKPKTGDIWRINFSRVQWETQIKQGRYIKKNKPENNWVWSPQGKINMHMPEKWGYLQFSDSENTTAIYDSNNNTKNTLMSIYYKQREYFLQHGYYAESLDKLNIKPDSLNEINLQATPFQYVVFIKTNNKIWFVNNDSKLWSKPIE